MEDKAKTFRVTAATHARFKKIADKECWQLNGYLERLVNEFCDRYEEENS